MHTCNYSQDHLVRSAHCVEGKVVEGLNRPCFKVTQIGKKALLGKLKFFLLDYAKEYLGMFDK
jgi:hypothetical protein